MDWWLARCSSGKNFLRKSSFSLSVSHSLSSFQDWGRAGDVVALGVCWHVPSQEEENFVFQLLSRLLHPELQRIKGHVSGEQPMSRCAVVGVFFSCFFSRFFSRRNRAGAQTKQKIYRRIGSVRGDK